MLDNYLVIGDTQIEIRFIEGEEQFAQQALAALGEALPAICEYFRLSGPFPQVRAVLVTVRDEFDRLVRDLLGLEIEVPSHPARIAQPQRMDMVLLSPSAYETHSIFQYVPADFRRLLVHELVHMVEELITPDIETTPMWWSEGLAVYLSGQWRYEDEFRQAAVHGLAQGNIPGFDRIAADRKLAYDWGWTIVGFIESACDREMVVRMVRECVDGQVLAVIGDDPGGLEARWRGWLLAGGI